jgi:hypothetical protein
LFATDYSPASGWTATSTALNVPGAANDWSATVTSAGTLVATMTVLEQGDVHGVYAYRTGSMWSPSVTLTGIYGFTTPARGRHAQLVGFGAYASPNDATVIVGWGHVVRKDQYIQGTTYYRREFRQRIVNPDGTLGARSTIRLPLPAPGDDSWGMAQQLPALAPP